MKENSDLRILLSLGTLDSDKILREELDTVQTVYLYVGVASQSTTLSRTFQPMSLHIVLVLFPLPTHIHLAFPTLFSFKCLYLTSFLLFFFLKVRCSSDLHTCLVTHFVLQQWLQSFEKPFLWLCSPTLYPDIFSE